MNLLSGQEKSIVTKIPGTTRDIVEDTIRLGDIVLNLADTAGPARHRRPGGEGGRRACSKTSGY